MTTVCDGDAVDGVVTPVVEARVAADTDGRIMNVDDVTVGKEMHSEQNGVQEAAGGTGVHCSSTSVGDYCGEVPVKSPAAELNGISVKDVASSSFNRTRTTSDTWAAEETEDNCIVDFLDKSNDKVYLSESYP
jgi:hypothetical protein